LWLAVERPDLVSRTLIEPVMFVMAAIGTAHHGAHRCDGTPCRGHGTQDKRRYGISGYVG
jgi:hypothetical protein